jgi:hypothetical protein
MKFDDIFINNTTKIRVMGQSGACMGKFQTQKLIRSIVYKDAYGQFSVKTPTPVHPFFKVESSLFIRKNTSEKREILHNWSLCMCF